MCVARIDVSRRRLELTPAPVLCELSVTQRRPSAPPAPPATAPGTVTSAAQRPPLAPPASFPTIPNSAAMPYPPAAPALPYMPSSSSSSKDTMKGAAEEYGLVPWDEVREL